MRLIFSGLDISVCGVGMTGTGVGGITGTGVAGITGTGVVGMAGAVGAAGVVDAENGFDSR